MAKKKTELAPEWWTVLLLYPDYADVFGHDTCKDFVKARLPSLAVAKARAKAMKKHPGIDNPEDLYLLSVEHGRNWGYDDGMGGTDDEAWLRRRNRIPK